MKNLMMMLVIVLVAFNTMQAQRTLNPVAYYVNGNISWNVNQNDLKSDFENAFGITIITMEFDYNPVPNLESYLFITGTDFSTPTNSVAIAIQIFGEPSPTGNGNDIFFDDTNGIFVKNTCTGNPCTSCAFTRGGWTGMAITGCKCNSSGKCNHSVEERDWIGTLVKTIGGLLN